MKRKTTNVKIKIRRNHAKAMYYSRKISQMRVRLGYNFTPKDMKEYKRLCTLYSKYEYGL